MRICNLTNNAIARFIDVRVAPGNKPEIDDVDEVLVEDSREIFDYESCAKLTQSIIVER